VLNHERRYKWGKTRRKHEHRGRYESQERREANRIVRERGIENERDIDIAR
jgi:hypothetical protein